MGRGGDGGEASGVDLHSLDGTLWGLSPLLPPGAPLSVHELDHRIGAASESGRPVDLVTARALAALLSHVCSGLEPTVAAFVHEGAIDDELRTWTDRLDRIPLDFIPWVAALAEVIDEAPAEPAVFLSLMGRDGSWLPLLVPEDSLAESVREVTATSLLPSCAQIDARAGFAGLSDSHLRRTPDADGLWGMRWVARGLAEYGDGFAALLVHDPPQDLEDVGRRWVGPVEDTRAVIYGIGLRDGWYTELAGLARHGLLSHLSLDIEGLWERYERLGWSLHRAPSGHLQLYRPYVPEGAELPRVVDLDPEPYEDDDLELL